MKGFVLRMTLALLVLALLAAPALAETEAAGEEKLEMRIYVAPGAMEDAAAQRMLNLLAGEFPQAAWSIAEGEELRTLVLLDDAPQLAVCGPGEARPWAGEELLLALDGAAQEIRSMQRQVVKACVRDETLFMAPLFARHRQMAVNVRMIEKAQFGYLLDDRAHPVWVPSELYQALEGCLLSELLPMEIWLPAPQDSLPIEAMVQALYGGFFLTQEGEICREDDDALLSGLEWLADMVDCGMIGMAESREKALNRFLSGETAIFIDWSEAEAQRHARRIADRGLKIAVLPYPSATGIPVRAYEVTGVSVFDSGDAQKNALALRAAAFLSADAQARQLQGERAIDADEAIWLPCLDADERGATLRSLFCRMLEDVLVRGERSEDALQVLALSLRAAQEGE